MKKYKFAIKVKTDNSFNYICDLSREQLEIVKMTLELLNLKFKVYLLTSLKKEKIWKT